MEYSPIEQHNVFSVDKKNNVIGWINLCVEDEIIPKEQGEKLLSRVKNKEDGFSEDLKELIDLLVKRHKSLIELSTDLSLSEEKKLDFLLKIKKIENLINYWHENILTKLN